MRNVLAVGYFAFNERFVGELDLSAREAGGDVFVGAGFFREDAEEESGTSYRDFQVWSLSGLEGDGSGVPTIAFDPIPIPSSSPRPWTRYSRRRARPSSRWPT